MTGGLLQIASAGNQDLYLTSNPKINFFKYVYKRYSNFSIETIPIKFNGLYYFNEMLNCDIPKNGDLINNCILKITLPEVEIKKTSSYTLNDELEKLNLSKEKNNVFNNFINIIFKIIHIINIDIDKNNITILNIQENAKNKLFELEQFYETYKKYMDNKIINIYDINNIIQEIVNLSLSNEEKKLKLKTKIKNIVQYTKIKLKEYQSEYILNEKLYNEKKNNNYNFAWIKNIGINIIDYIQFEIGGNIIDKQYGEWLYIWNKINKTTYQNKTLDILYGNIPELTTYNNSIKKTYDLYIPLKFWFNINSGLSLPILAFRYQQININLKLNKLSNCIYTDYINENNFLENNIQLNNIQLLVNYVFINNDERIKFTSTKLEYLIEQNNFKLYKLKINNINYKININLYNPVKNFIWTIQLKSNLDKYNLINKFTNYTVENYDDSLTQNTSLFYKITEKNTLDLKSILDQAQIELNGIPILKFKNYKYYNYLQPYMHYDKTPDDGIYSYNFSLHPLNKQPSGSINFTNIKKTNIILNLNKDFIANANDDDQILVKLYIKNYNILKINNGLGGLMFN